MMKWHQTITPRKQTSTGVDTVYLPSLPYTKNKKIIKGTIEWAGLNKKAHIADNEFSSTTNLSSRQSPLISPRPSRAMSYTLTDGWAMFAASQLAWVDGTTFKYNNVAKGDVTASAKSMVELSGRIVIFPDKKSYDTVGDTFAAFGSGSYPAAGSVPDIDYACTLDNRIWGVKNDDIYCTALGDFDDWTTFSSPSVATDAWHVDTGTNGNFTGIASYKGTNLVYKADRVFKRFGEIPETFQFIEISRLGSLSHKSIVEVNNILFWLSPQGVAAYTGGTPEVIGENLNDNYVSAVAGGDGRRYYISLYNGSSYALYVYDTWKGIWLQEDDLQVKDFAYLDGYLYALASDNAIYRFNYGTERVKWAAVTKEFTENISNKKGHSELFFRVDLGTNSSLQIYVKTDNGSFELVKAYSVPDLTTFVVPLKVKNADHFTVKLVGAGDCCVHEFVRKFFVGES
jgi:hypothetical protein